MNQSIQLGNHDITNFCFVETLLQLFPCQRLNFFFDKVASHTVKKYMLNKFWQHVFTLL